MTETPQEHAIRLISEIRKLGYCNCCGESLEKDNPYCITHNETGEDDEEQL